MNQPSPHAHSPHKSPSPSTPPFRAVTAASLFDGHDASINVIRRLLQQAGVEVIHLAHNRSANEIITTAIQEDADAICVSSYQGGHLEFFRYLRDLLKEKGAEHIQIFGGGGGTILPQEIEELHTYGIARIYHAEDGRRMGLEGMIQDMVSHLSHNYAQEKRYEQILLKLESGDFLDEHELAQAITLVEEESLYPELRQRLLTLTAEKKGTSPVLGVTGSGGAGKSSLVDELITRYLYSSPDARIGVLAFDPTKRKTGGALLGDRIRMNSIHDGRVYLRSMATRGSSLEVGKMLLDTVNLMRLNGFDLVIVETSGIGQGNAAVLEVSDLSMYVMTSEYGATTQLEKIDMLDYADLVAINKFDKRGAEDAFDDVLHTYAQQRNLRVIPQTRSTLPVFGTVASSFNNAGVTRLFLALVDHLEEHKLLKAPVDRQQFGTLKDEEIFTIIRPERDHYLQEISQEVRDYRQSSEAAADTASELYRLSGAVERLDGEAKEKLQAIIKEEKELLGEENEKLIEHYYELKEIYTKPTYAYTVRDKIITQPLYTESLSETKVPRIAVPRFRDWGSIVKWMRQENFPGYFPYTAGVFPLKNSQEEPKRQFAGEGGPKRTNTRFHYLSANDEAKRLSTAFDSVTLYGEDPAYRPDIYGKVGNSGVSIACLDHMKDLFRGFDLVAPLTSVSLTINGPAPIILAMFLNTAIDFEVEKQTGTPRETIEAEQPERYTAIRSEALQKVRGTVQADILKEEQAQNTCIFSAPFAIKMMGDIQEYFIEQKVRNFYSVSISGYHIAEAGANPITQLAFTLSNGFTYVEYYLSRGMHIDDFAPNLSFFFSAGLDPEYSVLGRVARRIWSIVIKNKYKGNARSCKLKYHIQTSGRSLHSQEIAFNDIRTTLQALMSIYDNCNSLHTNAYDEAITTPTEESVRRAMAIQLIINKEMGVARCENSTQGAFIYDELTDLVEEAVLHEFDSLSRRGGVLGATEKRYQRHRIQSESMKYELMKASGELPLIGVNTFLGEENNQDLLRDMPVIRAEEEEKRGQVESTHAFIDRAGSKNKEALERLKHKALEGQNIFEELMETVKSASLGQITHLLYGAGGEYRRSM